MVNLLSQNNLYMVVLLYRPMQMSTYSEMIKSFVDLKAYFHDLRININDGLCVGNGIL
jgi:hypothetical protein